MTQTATLEPPSMDHLDGLLERALAGKATPAELSQLRSHTASCAACAALLELGPSLSEKMLEAAPNGTRDQRMVARAMGRAGRPTLSRRSRLVLALAAAFVLLGSLAAAQYAGLLTPAAKTPVDAAAAPRAGQATKAPPAQRPAPEISEATTAPIVTPEALAQAAPSSGVEAAPESASSLFTQANQARRSGQDVQAIALYRKLQQTYPRSEQAALSHATLGSLLLQHGDAKAALGEFDRYVAHGGPVLEDALAGRARALGQLGDKAGEAQAWQKLLARFPASVHAARAHARLAELR